MRPSGRNSILQEIQAKMRPFIGLIVLVVAAIAIAGILTKSRPPGTLPYKSPEEQEAETNKAQSDKKPTPVTAAPVSSADAAKAFDAAKEGAIKATLVIEGRGTMEMELYPKAAPKTVAHIVDLCKKDFYTGIKVHRVEPGFVIQAGDPESKDVTPDQFEAAHIGTHGSGAEVPLEASLPHVAGSVGLARSTDPNSGDSQFYINLKNNDALNGQYCVFGRVVKGAEIADRVEKGDKITRFSVP